MNKARKPHWHTKDTDSAWDRIKAAFANDWEQTKADFGVEGARDMDQDADDTVKQAIGTDNAFENHEQAFRFGYAARRQFGASNPAWNEALETQLETDYDGDYRRDRRYIRHAYEYDYDKS
jgi:hypothetical protein